jgi:hypothetical protein
LINRSKADVDVSNLTFVQTDTQGTTLNFESARWEQGNRPITALPPGDCFQVMRDDTSRVEKPLGCGSQQAWSRVSFPHWFWISDEPQATFTVVRGDQVLATCTIEAGECAFYPDA